MTGSNNTLRYEVWLGGRVFGACFTPGGKDALLVAARGFETTLGFPSLTITEVK